MHVCFDAEIRMDFPSGTPVLLATLNINVATNTVEGSLVWATLLLSK